MTKNCIYCGIPADANVGTVRFCTRNPHGDHVFVPLDQKSSRCSCCGEVMLIGPPLTSGSIRSLECPYLGEDWHIEAFADVNKQSPTLHLQRRQNKLVAKRDPVSFRFDILDPEFLQALAAIADYGAKKYGDFNYHKSRLTGDKSPVNHMFKHLLQYQSGESYDHAEAFGLKDGAERKFHLAAVAFNAMMEFWYESHPEVK